MRWNISCALWLCVAALLCERVLRAGASLLRSRSYSRAFVREGGPAQNASFALRRMSCDETTAVVRFLRLTNDPVGGFLHVNELVAIGSNGRNIALGRVCNASSVWPLPAVGVIGLGCVTAVDGVHRRDIFDGFFFTAAAKQQANS